MEKFLYDDLYKLEVFHWWHKSKRMIIREYIDKYYPSNDIKILDVGCGTGENLNYFSDKGKIFGIDNSKNAISYCKLKGLSNIKLANAYQTGFRSKSFDVIFLLDVLEHVDEKRLLKELHRILKKNGKLFTTVPAYMFLWSEWDRIHHHKKRYTSQELIHTLSENGFTINKISYIYSFLLLPLFIVRLIKSIFKLNSNTSDFKINTKTINIVLLKITKLERILIRYNLIKFGTSIFCVSMRYE